ncbi:MAG: hypothetical protein ACRDR6_05665 [Pseudonocardiaceae bacterium]
MTEVVQHRSEVTVNAPVKKVFDTLSNLEVVAALAPGVTSIVRDGDSIMFDYTVRPLGINADVPFVGIKASIGDAQEPTVVTHVVDGPIKGTFHWNLQSQKDDTFVALEVSYQLETGVINGALGSAGLLGGVVGGVTVALDKLLSPILDANAATADHMVVNLKKICEG